MQLLLMFILFFAFNFAVKKDYYQILGVKQDATQREIKKQFHALSRKYHPDHAANKGEAGHKRMTEITEAYATLSDEDKRKQYDLTLSDSPGQFTHNFHSQPGTGIFIVIT
jgi:DnaJ-class molecular chaperone